MTAKRKVKKAPRIVKNPTLPIKLHKRTICRSYGLKEFTALKVWQGVSAFDGKEIMAVLSNYATNSDNKKIGLPFCQLYTLPVGVVPNVGFQEKHPTVCGSCTHLGNGCYVQWQWLLNLYNCTKDQVPYFDSDKGQRLIVDLVKDQLIRIGAAGDPMALPFWLVKRLVSVSKAHTSYTHAWMNLDLVDSVEPCPYDDEMIQTWQDICMASVDSPAEYDAARALGWRTFRTLRGGLDSSWVRGSNGKDRFLESSQLLKGEVECLADSHKKTCADCMLCDGTRRSMKIRNVVIGTHGSNMYKFHLDPFLHPKFDQVRARLLQRLRCKLDEHVSV